MEEIWSDEIIDFTTKDGWRKGMALFEAEHKAARAKPKHRALMLDTAGSDLATSGLDLCSACTAKIDAFLAARKKKRHAGTPHDIDVNERGEMSAEERRYRGTAAGLLTPAENDFPGRPEMTLDLTRGLTVPDDAPARPMSPEQRKRVASFDQLRALFLEEEPDLSLSSEETRQRAMIAKARREGRDAGGMALPLE
jgi:hypothetical protein